MQRGDIRCRCGRAARVGSARKQSGRLYANCAAWPNAGCDFFTWLEPAVAPSTPDRAAADTEAAAPRTPSPLPRAAPKAAPSHAPASPPAPADSHAAHACVRAFLVVRAAPAAAAGWQETVSLVLLPALELPPAACAALYQPAGERRLPHAPTAAASLQLPYVRLQSWAPAAAVQDSMRRCISAAEPDSGGDSSCWPLFVLDTETTGLSSEWDSCTMLLSIACHLIVWWGQRLLPVLCRCVTVSQPFSNAAPPGPRPYPAGSRDHVHQLAVLNVASGQLLSLLLRACPAVMHPSAIEVRLGKLHLWQFACQPKWPQTGSQSCTEHCFVRPQTLGFSGILLLLLCAGVWPVNDAVHSPTGPPSCKSARCSQPSCRLAGLLPAAMAAVAAAVAATPATAAVWLVSTTAHACRLTVQGQLVLHKRQKLPSLWQRTTPGLMRNCFQPSSADARCRCRCTGGELELGVQLVCRSAS